MKSFTSLLFSATAKDTSKLFIGNAAGSVLAIVFTILAARELGPDDWGLVAAVGSLVGILTAFGELGLDAALLKFVPGLLQKGKRAEAKKIFGAIFTVRVVSAITFSLILILGSSLLAPALFSSDNSLLVVFSGLMLFGALMLDFQIAQAQARSSWVLAAAFLTLTNIFRVAFYAALLILGLANFLSILVIFSLSPLAAFLLTLFWSRPGFSFKNDWSRLAGQIAHFSGWMSANKIVASANSRIDVLLLVNFAGAYEAGIYSAANRLALGVPLIVGSFATVLAPRFSSMDVAAVTVYFRKTIWFSALITAGLGVGILVAPLVISLFGSEFADSTGVLQLLFVSFIPFVLATPAVNLLIYGLKKPKIIALTTIFQLPMILVINLSLIPSLGVYAPIIALATVNTTTLVVSYFFVWRSLGNA